jgi:hypothetical protein
MADWDGRDTFPGTLTRQQGASGPNFDSAYDAYEGIPPWDIGAPQPDLAGLAQGATLKGRVLDVGCGMGEHALLVASPSGFSWAMPSTSVPRGEQFDTVIDSGLFHVFDGEQRTRYVGSLRAATALGGHLLLLCFSDRIRASSGRDGSPEMSCI